MYVTYCLLDAVSAMCLFHIVLSATFSPVCIRDVRGGVFSSGAGRGEDKNPRGGVGRGEGKNPRGRAKKRVNQLIQKFDKCEYL